MDKIKKIDLKYIHIALIIIGIIFISLSAFHTGLWFDESYSVGMAGHSFKDIWTIGKNDVHPILYYWILHVLNLIFGNNILVYRLFSVVCIAILGIIGYTHIRKDFSPKVGIMFSFLVYFFPVNIVYSSEIRMYSLSMLLVTLTFIYAYRIYRKINNQNEAGKITENNKLKHTVNWIIFVICSLTAAYTHYYALLASALINLWLMIILITDSVKNKKISSDLKIFIISAIIQIALYLPWILSIIIQMAQSNSGFWIQIHFPNTLIELFTFPFTGNLTDSNLNYVNVPVALVWSSAVTIYMIYLYAKDIRKTKSEKRIIKIAMKPAIIAISLFLLVPIGACIASIIIGTPIIYARYLLCPMGILIFFLAYTMQVKGIKSINVIICITSLLLSLYININLIKTNYDKSNTEPIEYISQDIEPGDIILFNNEGSGFVVAVNFQENKAYFYDEQHWNVEKAYKAFGENFNTVYDLDWLENYEGRIWAINSEGYHIVEKAQEKCNINIIKQEMFNTEYKGYKYSISLIEINE